MKELDLEIELKRQAKKYVDLGFHKELNLTEQEYFNSLPKSFPQSMSGRGRFEKPILVETRISLVKLAALTGIEDQSMQDFKSFHLRDWEGDPKKFKTPRQPYTTWVCDGERNSNINVGTIRSNLKEDERMTTLLDGIALYVSHPEILEICDIVLGGTVYEPNYTLWLGEWYAIPCLELLNIDDELSPALGAAICGRKLGFKE